MSLAFSPKTRAPHLSYCEDTLTREVLRGLELRSPRPALPHVFCGGQLFVEISLFFRRQRDAVGAKPGDDWVILAEPELHLEGEDPIVPDIAGWRRERMPLIPRAAAVRLAPDWVCEVLSPSTERIDRTLKLDIYGTAGVGHVWLVDPLEQRVEVFARAAAGYHRVDEAVGDARLRAAPFAALALALADIWPSM